MGENSSVPTVIGRYQIRRRLGEGGMGIVYLAHDPAMDCEVAIKLLRDAIANDDLRKRFAREAQMARRVGVHPHVVTIFDIGEHEGRSFIAMEYVAGETLEHVIHRAATLPPMRRRLEIVEELCVGLMHAHKAGLVHRDIKPANIMIAESGTVKILDFGVARLADSDLTAEGVVIGALNYMSPEQMTGTPLDARSDVFAVGAVFYELLSGKRAFPGSLREGLPYRIIHGSPPALAQLVDQLDPEIERIVQRALEKDPANRYPDIASMRHDITRVRRRLQAAEGAIDPDAETSEYATEVLTPIPRPVTAAAPPAATPAQMVPPPAPSSQTATPVPAAAPAPPTPAATPASKAGGGPPRMALVMVGVAVLIAVGAGAWFATRSAESTPQSTPPQSTPPQSTPRSQSAPAAPAPAQPDGKPAADARASSTPPQTASAAPAPGQTDRVLPAEPVEGPAAAAKLRAAVQHPAAAAQPPAQPAAKPPAEARASSAPPQTASAAPAPKQGERVPPAEPAAGPPARAGEANAAAEAAIVRAMREFSAAWNRGDAEGVRRVFPAFAGEATPRFKNFELEFETPHVTIDGHRAEMQTVVRHIPRSAKGKDRPARVNDAVFHFVERDNRWVMLGNQPVQKEPKED